MEAVLDFFRDIIPYPFSLGLDPDLREMPLSVPRSNPHFRENIEPLMQGPIFRNPLSDLFCAHNNIQEGPTFCANIEMMMLNCMEQYGYERGLRMCNGYLIDLEECVTHTNERYRNHLMLNERHRQFAAGERPVRYEPAPPVDSV